MGLLLPTGTATRTRPVPVEDDHGWVTTEVDEQAPVVTFPVNLQLDPGAAYVTADEQGGAGPYAPRVTHGGTVYCDADEDVQPGDLLTIDGTTYTVRTVRVVTDPASLGNDCLSVLVGTS
jgi:hypothetical protein